MDDLKKKAKLKAQTKEQDRYAVQRSIKKNHRGASPHYPLLSLDYPWSPGGCGSGRRSGSTYSA